MLSGQNHKSRYHSHHRRQNNRSHHHHRLGLVWVNLKPKLLPAYPFYGNNAHQWSHQNVLVYRLEWMVMIVIAFVIIKGLFKDGLTSSPDFCEPICSPTFPQVKNWRSIILVLLIPPSKLK